MLKHEFIRDITLTENLTSFLGLEIEQGPEGINIHLDTYIKEAIEDSTRQVFRRAFESRA